MEDRPLDVASHLTALCIGIPGSMGSGDEGCIVENASMRRRMIWVRALLLASLALLVTGAAAPLLTTGRFLVFSSTFSLLSGLRELVATQQVALAIVIGFFALCVPVIKAVVMWAAASSPAQSGALLMIVDRFGKWSMLEVFVAALVIVAVKLGPIASADLHHGAYLLAAAVVLSGFASQLLAIDLRQRPLFSGAATLAIGAAIGAVAAVLVIGVLHPGLFSGEAFETNARARCIQGVLRLERSYAEASASPADYAASLRAIDYARCPEAFREAFAGYVEASERLALWDRRAEDTGLMSRVSSWLGLESTREDALQHAAEAWNGVVRAASDHGVRVAAR